MPILCSAYAGCFRVIHQHTSSRPCPITMLLESVRSQGKLFTLLLFYYLSVPAHHEQTKFRIGHSWKVCTRPAPYARISINPPFVALEEPSLRDSESPEILSPRTCCCCCCGKGDWYAAAAWNPADGGVAPAAQPKPSVQDRSPQCRRPLS